MKHDLLFYQAVILGIVVIIISKNCYKLIVRKKTFNEFIISIIFWIGFGMLALFPNISQKIADITGFELGINALLVFTTITLIFAVFSLMLRISKLEKDITGIVRNTAINNAIETIDRMKTRDK